MNTIQYQLESKLNKNQLLPRLRQEVQEVINLPQFSHIDKKIMTDALAYMLLYKRTEPGMLMGLLYPKFKNKDLIVNEVEKMVKSNLIQFDPENDQLITNLVLDPITQDELDKFMYPLPLVQEPKKLTSNKDTGYWYSPSGSVILKNNFTLDDVNLDHINRINSIEYKINTDVLWNQNNKWEHCSFTTQQQKKNFEKFNTLQKKVCSLYLNLGNKFYLTSKYDKRGRVYYQGYFINPQGNDYAKALLEFSHGEKIG